MTYTKERIARELGRFFGLTGASLDLDKTLSTAASQLEISAPVSPADCIYWMEAFGNAHRFAASPTKDEQDWIFQMHAPVLVLDARQCNPMHMFISWHVPHGSDLVTSWSDRAALCMRRRLRDGFRSTQVPVYMVTGTRHGALLSFNLELLREG